MTHITVTEAAAKQITEARKQADCGDIPLRIAIDSTKNPQSGQAMFHYRMGFDDVEKESDHVVDINGVSLVFDAASSPLAKGMTLDFIELNGTLEFVFLNPNDPSFIPPVEA